MSERDLPTSQLSTADATADMILAAIDVGEERGRLEALGLKNRIPTASSPTGRFKGWWDRITGITAARKQGYSEAMLHILGENARARQEGFQEGQLNGVRLVAATAAHTINNALAPIQGGVELLGLAPAINHDPALLKYVLFIKEGAEIAAQRVGDLLQIRRIVLDQSNPNIPLLNMEASTKPEEPQP